MSVAGTYFLYYIVVLSTSIIVYFSELIKTSQIKKASKFIFWSSLIIPVIVAGYRFDVGADYFSYEKMYYNLTATSASIYDNMLNTRYEPGWIILNHFVKFIFNNSTYIFVISAFLTWILFLKAIYSFKNKVSMGIAVLVLFTTLYNISFNTVRQTLAISVLILSIKPLLNRNFVKFIVPVLVAGCFHYTAFIFAPSYWIINARYKNSVLIKNFLVITLFITLVIFINPMLSFITNFDVFSTYDRYELEYSGFNIKNVILRIPIFIIILLNYKKLKINNNPTYRLVILYIIGFILLNLGDFSVHVGRISRYFEALQIFIIGAIVTVQKNKYEKLLYGYLIIIYFLLRFTVIYLVSGQQQTVPYHSVFFG